ncbi:HK97-gp10 family putative phage morphogenesis protein [Streptomonospora litoralis]|uniref:HK97 gp10 family phage protein n=1 Tax=Streptomonospora litoralis TaxID=2498135 RepID=A0A4P6Q8K1_9ACTN|nr:HK97-gp10 family putative phage morphogenesis protein [Streptomonospora litoralis]QBI56800.1 hypothetical protein EKD16_25295 [Streptomonospora litoralis]
MPGRVSVEIRGADKLTDRLKQLRPAVKRGTRTAVEASGKAMRTGMRNLAPVRTGALRDSIDYELVNDGLTARAGPGDWIDYAIFQEFGTSRMPAQPYIRPVAEAERRLFPERVRMHVREEMDRRRGSRRSRW